MKIIIIDDDVLVSSALKTIIEANEGFAVLATGNSGREAIELYKKHSPDIVLMDIRMNDINGLDAAEEIIRHDSKAKILFLTTFADDEYIIKSLQIGSKGYILKHQYNSLIPALTAVHSGQTVFGDEIISKIPKVLTNQKQKADYQSYGLTQKEYQIIELISKGYSNKEIATELYLSEGTLRNYISIILEKLNLRDRTQIAIFYFTHLQ